MGVKRFQGRLCARSRRSRSLWTKPQTSSEKVKTFLPASDARRAIAIEVRTSRIAPHVDAGVFGEAVVGRHMGRSRAAPLGSPERDIRTARSSTSFGKMELPRRP